MFTELGIEGCVSDREDLDGVVFCGLDFDGLVLGVLVLWTGWYNRSASETHSVVGGSTSIVRRDRVFGCVVRWMSSVVLNGGDSVSFFWKFESFQSTWEV